MKKCFINAFIIASVVFAFNTLSATADGIEVVRDVDNQIFTISGMSEPFSVIRAIVTAPGKEHSDAGNALNPFDVVKYQTELDAGEDGKFSFDVELSSQSGVYTAYIAIGDTIEEVELEYVNPTNYGDLIKGLNSASDVEDYINQNRDGLGFFLDLYDSVNKSTVCSIIEKEIPLSESDIKKCVDIFNSAVVLTAVSEGKISGVKEYSDKLEILSGVSLTGEWYKTVNANDVDTKLKKGFNSIEEFNSSLCEAIVLSVVKTPNGYLNVKKVISDFKAQIGITSLLNDDRIYKELAGKSFNSYVELKNEYQRLSGKYTAGNSSSGSGGGGGGASGGGGANGGGADIAALPSVPKESTTPIKKKHFSDMENASWAEEACEYLAEKEILSGKSEGVFAPLDLITREEFVAIIVRAFKFEKYADNNMFSDLSESDWCYGYVLAANQNGIINGVTENSFGKGMNISRQDMATILYRVMTVKGVEQGETVNSVNFSDEENIADYAKEAVEFLSSRGIINGMNDGSFCGEDNAQRAQAAQMIYKVLKSMEG